jgi:hypothetical protein
MPVVTSLRMATIRQVSRPGKFRAVNFFAVKSNDQYSFMLRLGVRGLGAEPAPREDCTLPGRTVNPPLLPLRHVEHLGAQAHRGNLVCKQSGFSPISASAADNPPLLPLRHVEHLGAQAHRGNVVCKQSGFSPISASAADKLPRGRRGQRNGLVYHPEYDGFAPDSWQVVINAHESARLELAGAVDGAPSTIVDIQRAPATTEARLLEITEFAIDQHAMVPSPMASAAWLG